MRKARKKEERQERVPFGVLRQKMNLDPETVARLRKEKKVPRWINDTGTRIQNALAGGYEFVDAADVRTGDAKVLAEDDRHIRKHVGTHKDGSLKYAYLMAIPEKFYKEDQASKEARNKRVDDAIRGGQPEGLSPHGVDSRQGSSYVKGVDYKP